MDYLSWLWILWLLLYLLARVFGVHIHSWCGFKNNLGAHAGWQVVNDHSLKALHCSHEQRIEARDYIKDRAGEKDPAQDDGRWEAEEIQGDLGTERAQECEGKEHHPTSQWGAAQQEGRGARRAGVWPMNMLFLYWYLPMIKWLKSNHVWNHQCTATPRIFSIQKIRSANIYLISITIIDYQ